ncbi:MAG: hypothetical protein E7624_01415 [Ruminococcaceae bacterium]|nr:hypothetical protein [Oscillospiraceae bacterium]
MKKKVTLIVTVALCLLFISLGAFLFFTRGNTYVSEGITQNDRVKIKDVRYENGTVYYTLVNHSRSRVYYGEKPSIEKLVGEEWVSFALWSSRHSVAYVLSPFSEQECSFSVTANTDRLAGKYRLSFGSTRYVQDENGSTYLRFDENETYIIGHLEITEEQAPTSLPQYVYYDNGVKKHAQVDFTASLVGGTEPKLLLTLTNNSESPLTLQLSNLRISRYQNGYFYQIGTHDYYMLPLEDTTVAPGETLHLERPIYNERYTMEPIAPPPTGRYRVNIPYYFENATKTEEPQAPPNVFGANHIFDHFD